LKLFLPIVEVVTEAATVAANPDNAYNKLNKKFY